MKTVLTIGPNKGVRVYESLSAASRALSGTGTTDLRFAIADRISNGGGYVGNVYVADGSKFETKA